MMCFEEEAESVDLASVLQAFPTKLVDPSVTHPGVRVVYIAIVHITSCPALNLFECLYISLPITGPPIHLLYRIYQLD